MIEESAQVVSREGQHAWIETERKSSCGACSARSGCGTSVLGKVLGQRPVRVRALNRIGAEVGDRVVVGLDDEAMVRGSAAVYLVPLISMFAGALVAQAIAPQWGMGEGLSIVGAGLGLAAGFGWLRLFGRRVQADERYQAVVLRKVPAHSSTMAPVTFHQQH